MAQKKITDLTARTSFDGTVYMPGEDTSQTWRVSGAQLLTYIQSLLTQQDDIKNLSIATSVSASALTIAVKTKAGSNASASDPITVAMRSSTLTTGPLNLRSITGALSLVISSGSTLGQVDGQAGVIWVYLIDNAGTLELAASRAYYAEDAVVSTTAEGGAGGADSATAIYSTSARSNVAVRLVGYILNTQTTAGTWASSGTQIQNYPTNNFKFPTITRLATATSGTYNTPAGVKYLRVKMSGGGGSGASSGGGGHTGLVGGDTTFGTSLLTCTGGTGGAQGNGGADGGSGTVNSPAIAIEALQGGAGSGGGTALSAVEWLGGAGGNNPFGGAGMCSGQGNGNDGFAGKANTGGGGGGGGTTGVSNSGSGGGAGGYLYAQINNPLASYAWVVGAGGVANNSSANSNAGNGGSGVIIIEEFYQ